MEGFDQAQVYLARGKERHLITTEADGEIQKCSSNGAPREGWLNTDKLHQINRADVCYLVLDEGELAIVIKSIDGNQAHFFAINL